MSMSHIMDIRDSLVEELKQGRRRLHLRRSSTPTSSKLASKKFKEDEMVPKKIEQPKQTEIKKILPTMKSLAKENKKMQRLLNISLKHRHEDNAAEGNGPNLVPITDSSYSNMSVRTEFRMNTSIFECPSQDRSKASGVEDG